MQSNSGSGSPGAILFVLPWAPAHAGGVTGVVLNLMRHWDGGLRPRLLVSDWACRRPADIDGVTHFRATPLGQASPLGLAKALLAGPPQLWRLARLLQRSKVRAVNFHYPGGNVLGVALLKRLGIYRGRLILSYHGTDVRRLEGRLDGWVQRLCLASADAVVVCSPSLGERLSRTLDGILPAHRLVTIRNGVDASLFTPQAGHGRAQQPYLLSVGSYMPVKAHELTIRAFARLAVQFPMLRLVIAGPQGPELPALQALVEELALAGRVELRVNLRPLEVAGLMASARLMVQSSRSESFPLALLEAAAAGTPIVASRIPGHQELVKEGRTGTLFEGGSVVACALAISAALGAPARVQAMARALRQTVTRELSWEASVAGYAALAD
ncbi:glycosyltransferase family 4 protein [Pelomonas sp. KK5]|uniref:glycosyltransferase family 4 protein n=1 Tax=Pelomonas sp. KK5 TaxID=1855730 RepID=UPI00097BAFFE|nr:glycosyltransferase family 4 protein [Pelomonas sp. KK5]